VTKAKKIACLETAYDFGKRFPDVSNWDILDHVNDVEQVSIHEDSWLGHACIVAYDGRMSEAIAMLRSVG
jgi:hypothetical protein